MILILTRPDDTTADDLMTHLHQRGVRYFRYNSQDFPQKAIHRFYKRNGISRNELEIEGNCIDFNDVYAVWYRSMEPPLVTDAMAPEDREFAKRETDLIFHGILQTLQDRFWVNPHSNVRLAEYKPYQLQLAQAIGFEIPPTLITNDPNEVQKFYCQTGKNMIYKSVSQYLRRGNPQAGIRNQGIYTNRVQEKDLERLKAVTHAPCLFQEYIAKKVELRITVVGRKIFAAEIHSQQSQRSKDDWRRYDIANTPYLKHRLPEAIKTKCQQLVRELGLVFGCIDMIVTPDNRYVFLEINPNGQWGWVEELTQLPICANLAEMLIQGTALYTDPVALSA